MGLAPHGWNSSHLYNRVSTPQRKASVDGSNRLSAPPPPSSWQNGPPQVGEGCRDHMTLLQGPDQLLGCQWKPRAEPLLRDDCCCLCPATPAHVPGQGTFLSSGHQ